MDELEKRERLAYAAGSCLTEAERLRAIRMYGQGRLADDRPSEVIVREMRDEWPDRQSETAA